MTKRRITQDLNRQMHAQTLIMPFVFGKINAFTKYVNVYTYLDVHVANHIANNLLDIRTSR